MQHDYNISNASRSNVRADINGLTEAIATRNSGATAPPTQFPYQQWASTANGVLYRRNAANTADILDGTLAETLVVAKSASYTALLSDHKRTLVCTNSFSLALTAAASLGDGWECGVRNAGTGAITIDPDGSEAIDGATTLILYPGQSCLVRCSGSAFYTVGFGERINREETTLSGTSINLSTTIGAGANRVVIVTDGLSTNGTSPPVLQLGDSGGYETTGYVGYTDTNSGVSGTTYSAVNGFALSGGWGATVTESATIILTRITGNKWAYMIVGSSELPAVYHGNGVKTLSGELTSVRLTTVGGINTFDAGTATVQYDL